MTNFGKKMLSFFAVFFLTLCMIGCQMSNEVGDRTESKEAKENVQWLLSNFNFGEVINNNVKDPVIGNVGIAEDLDGQISENDLRNGSYSEFMYGMSASFESSNPEVMNAEWVTYKKRAYVYGDPANPDKITGIETQETTVLEFVVNRPAADQEDVQVDITIKVKAPYQVGEQTYYHEGTRTLTFTVLKKAESNTMTVGELEDYIIANWASFTNGSLFKDENGNDLNVSIEGVVTEQVWGDGYTSHSFTMADDNGNGIYVYGPQSPVNIGDRVIVTGKPATYNGTIQIGLDSTVEVISEASEYVPAEETTLEEWYAKYPTQATDHKVPGKRIKVSGLFIQKTVDGYTNYAIQSTESDHFIQIYYKSYGAYEEELLKEMLGKAAEFEIAMYYCHNNGYWVGILNNYDYKPELIEMTAEDKLAADVAGIKVSQTVKNGEKVDLPTGALANGTVLSGWTADKEGYINLETLEANLGATKEDVKVTLTATATNGEASQEVKVEVTIKYVKGEIAEKTVKELIELTEEMLETFKVTGTVVQWGNKIGTPDEAPTMYGNFILQGEDGSQIVVYGSTASESALVWDSATGKYKYTNAKDFLTNELTSQIKLGDKVELLVVRTSYNGNPQLNAVVLGIKNDKVEVTHHVLGVYQASLGKTLYVTGNVTNERYLETTEDITLAAKVYIEEVEGGSRFYILEGETKKYLDTYMNSANKISLRFDAASECVYAYDEATKAWVTNVDGTDYYFGTYSTFETLSASKTSYITAENTGVSQFPGFLQPVEGKVEEGEKEVAHLLGVYQASLGKTLYVTGNVTNERYLETTEDITLAAKVYIEEVEGGSRFYILEGETKKYLDTYMNSANKISLRFDAASECVYAYDEATKAWVTNVDGTDYYFGTYSTFETLSASKTSYITAENTGVSQFPGFLEKAEAGETPEPPVHEHNFVEGKCACGEVDPNYVAPEVPANEIVFDFTTGSTGIGSAYNTAAAEITMNGITFGYLQMKSSGYDGNNFVMFCKSTDAHIYNKTAFAGSIVKIEVFIPSGASATAQYFLSLHTEAAAGNITSTVSYKGAGGSFVIEATEADGFKYFNLSSDSTTTKNGQLAKIVVTLAGGQTPEPPVHEHEFVEGKCACGEVDPNYVAPEVPTTEVVKEGVAYLLGVNQVSVGKTIYVTGEVTTRYLVTTTDTALAAKVYAEKAEGGYKFYILDGETKKYLDTYFNSDSKISLQFSADSTCVYTYNADTKAWATNVNGTNYYFGTYSTFETLSASNTSYINSQNTGVSQFPGFFVEAPEVETPEPPVHEHEFVEGKCACGEEDPNYVAPEVQTANKADFDTMGAKSSSYLDRTSEAGWTATFAALNCGGTSDSNPQFIVFGDVTNFAVTLAGGTDKVGTLTSPLLNNGLAKLTFNYTKLFTDTTLSITVYVKDAEGNVLYSEVVTYAAEKNEKYVVKTYELVLDTPIEGDFVIQIVNNCPMGLTGNKDRISIWNLTWENAPVHEHDFVEGKCECGEEDPNYVAPEVTKTATLAYTAGTTTNMKANTNNAATVGLDAELFTVTSLNNGNNNHVGLNKDGTTRLYANKTDGNGNTLVIESEKTIKSIEITFGSTVGAFTVNGQEGSKTVAVYEINGNKVEIQNVQTGATTQVHIKTIVITYVE